MYCSAIQYYIRCFCESLLFLGIIILCIPVPIYIVAARCPYLFQLYIVQAYKVVQQFLFCRCMYKHYVVYTCIVSLKSLWLLYPNVLESYYIPWTQPKEIPLYIPVH